MYLYITFNQIWNRNWPLHLKQTFMQQIWIFTEGEGDEIESIQPFKIFSTLNKKKSETT